MTIEDIKNYIIKHNLDTSSRKAEFIDCRMYLYAILYHQKRWSLTKIAKLFKKKDHIPVRSALMQAHYLQYDERFIENTQELMELHPFVIPPYINQNECTNPNYDLLLNLDKESFIRYMQTKDMNVVYDMLWEQMVQTAYRNNAQALSHPHKYKHS